MGATAAIGTGLSVVGGLAQASQRSKQQQAQKKAIASQAQMDQLNADLQLMALEQQYMADQRQSLLNQAVEQEAYLNQQMQLNVQDMTNQTALAQAELQNNTALSLADAQQRQAQNTALQQQISGTAQANQGAIAAQAASGERFGALNNQLAQQTDQERQRTISNLMQIASTQGGENLALDMLAELTGETSMAEVEQLAGLEDARNSIADDIRNATIGEVDSQRNLTETQAALQASDQRFSADSNLLDIATARRTDAAARTAEQIALDSAFTRARR